MDCTEETFEWETDGERISLGMTRCGTGPLMLLFPAPSSISTRGEMRGLQEALADHFTTIAMDLPGFGNLARPAIDWTPLHYVRFVGDMVEKFGTPQVTVAAGHASGYVLAWGAAHPGSLGRIALLSPTWRGPLPTMSGRRLPLFRGLARAVDVPVAGSALYRTNVNGPVIGMMSRGHVYEDPQFLSGARMAFKRAVTEAPGARHASWRFVTGELDLFHDRTPYIEAAEKAAGDEHEILLLRAQKAPRKSAAEMQALAMLPEIRQVTLPRGKLSFYEEFPEDTAHALIRDLAGQPEPA